MDVRRGGSGAALGCCGWLGWACRVREGAQRGGFGVGVGVGVYDSGFPGLEKGRSSMDVLVRVCGPDTAPSERRSGPGFREMARKTWSWG